MFYIANVKIMYNFEDKIAHTHVYTCWKCIALQHAICFLIFLYNCLAHKVALDFEREVCDMKNMHNLVPVKLYVENFPKHSWSPDISSVLLLSYFNA